MRSLICKRFSRIGEPQLNRLIRVGIAQTAQRSARNIHYSIRAPNAGLLENFNNSDQTDNGWGLARIISAHLGLAAPQRDYRCVNARARTGAGNLVRLQ